MRRGPGIVNTYIRQNDPEFFSLQVRDARRFYLDLNPTRNKSLAVVCGGLEHCATDYSIHRTAFPYFGIEYVVQGRGELTLGSTTYALKSGVLFAYSPSAPHCITTEARAPLIKYFVDFTGTCAARILKTCGLAGDAVVQVFPPDCIVALFEEFIEGKTHPGLDGGDFYSKLLECLALKIGAVATPPKDAESLAFTAYLKCRSTIERDFLRLKSLEQIATVCGMDGAYICRLFRRFSHQSPYQYLLHLKINCAAAELQKSDILVKDLATMVGFKDSFHFSRTFRKLLGTSPAQFRNLR
jgi:AraC-like DNA-binding protein